MFPPLASGGGGLWWRGYQEPKTLLSGYPGMLRMLHDRYRKVEEVEGFEIWTRVD